MGVKQVKPNSHCTKEKIHKSGGILYLSQFCCSFHEISDSSRIFLLLTVFVMDNCLVVLADSSLLGG